MYTVSFFSPFSPAWDDYMNCYIGKRPASAFVTKNNASAATVKKIQDTLKAAGIKDLKTGGIVNSFVENLVPYDNTAITYVGDYGDYYKALGGDKDCSGGGSGGGSGKCSGTASSLFVSFTLLITAIFAFLQLA